MLTESPTKQQDTEVKDIDLGHFVPYLLHNLDRHFQSVLANALAPYSLTVAEWRTLFCLQRSGVSTIDEICRFVHLPQPTVSRTVQKMHEKKLVRRGWNKNDNRVAEIRISGAGERRNALATEAARRICDAEVHRLAGGDAEQWIDVMRKILWRLGPEKFHDND